MTPPLRWVDAHSAADAVALLAHHAGAQPIAAGGDLFGLMKEGVEGPTLQPPQVLVNLASARDLHGIVPTADGLRLGAMSTLADLAAHADVPPMLAQAVARIASPQLRQRTTLGGNLLQRPRCLYFRHPDEMCFKKGGTGCPAVGGPPEAWPGALFPGPCHAGHPSDLAPVLVALDARAELHGPVGARSVALIDLYQDAAANPAREARLSPHEIVSAIVLPPWPATQAFEKIAPRAANEFAWASAAVVLQLTHGRITHARVALGGVFPAPLLWRDEATGLPGLRLNEIDAERVTQHFVPRNRIADQQRERVAACAAALQRALSRLAGATSHA